MTMTFCLEILNMIQKNGLCSTKYERKKKLQPRSLEISNTLTSSPRPAACKQQRYAVSEFGISPRSFSQSACRKETLPEKCLRENFFLKVIEHLKLRVSRNADDRYQLKAHQKTDKITEKCTIWTS